MTNRRILLPLALFLAAPACNCRGSSSESSIKILNVSYDPTRELYADFNQAFTRHWAAAPTAGGAPRPRLVVDMSHGGSGKQARAVIDGLEADVVTLALAHDIDMLHARADLLPATWQQRLPYNSSPYTSTIVFVVRKGNPRSIRDWEDLARPGISVITPSPKTSGGARWNYLAAWGYASRKEGGDESKARELVAAIYRNTPLLDAAARAATTTFAERGIGDVLIAWEDEALLLAREVKPGEVEVVIPSLTILAEPPVAVVDHYADKHRTHEVAEAYLRYLYSEEGQEIAARHYFRPRLASVAARHADLFAPINTFSIDDLGGWSALQKKHFDDGGVFDQIYRPR